MKVSVKLDCTPEEARKLLGLPDVSKINEKLVGQLSDKVKGATSMEQLQGLTKTITPMGEAGLKLFGQILSGSTGSSRKTAKKSASKKSKSNGRDSHSGSATKSTKKTSSVKTKKT